MPDIKRVFVVYGRNLKARKAMFRFLEALGLQPLKWDDVANETAKTMERGNPGILDILDHAFAMAQAVVVLFTADEVARLRKRYRDESHPEHENERAFQPRPNVLFEAGLALGRHPSRTLIVQVSSKPLREISDLGGLHILKVDGSRRTRKALANRLEAIGCSVERERDDWLEKGDFESAI